MVTIDTAQTVSGAKTFTGAIKVPTVTATDDSTNVATTAFVRNVLSRVLGGTRPTQTLIFGSLTNKSKAVGDGTITLTQSWKNFDALLIVGGNDSMVDVQTNIVPVWVLAQRIEIAKAYGLTRAALFQGSSLYWEINASSSTNTKLYDADENCVIYAIVGLKW